MREHRVAGRDRRDAPGRVGDRVDHEVEPGEPAGFVHVLADRIAVGLAEARAGREHQRVVLLDRRLAGDAGQDDLAAAAEAGVHVRRDVAERDAEVDALDDVVDEDRRAERCDAAEGEAARLVIVGDEVRVAEEVAVLRGRPRVRRPVEAGGVDRIDVRLGDAGALQLGDEQREERGGRRRAGRVVEEDGDLLAGPDALGERRRADRIGDGGGEERFEARRRRPGRRAGDADEVALGQLEG